MTRSGPSKPVFRLGLAAALAVAMTALVARLVLGPGHIDPSEFLPRQALTFALPDRLPIPIAAPGVLLSGGSLVMVSPPTRSLDEVRRAVDGRSAVMTLEGTTLRIGVGSPGEATVAEAPAAPDGFDLLTQAILRQSFESLSISDSTVVMALTGDHEEIISNVTAKVTAASGTLTAKGSGEIRGQAHKFELAVIPVSATKDGAAGPEIRFNLDGPIWKATIRGQGVKGGSLLKGTANIRLNKLSAIPVAAQLLNSTQGHTVSVSGSLDWTPEGIAFDKASVDLDGQDASGALSIGFEGPCAVVNGTLAAQSINLNSWLPPRAAIASRAPAPERDKIDPLPWIIDKALAVTLSECPNADLRISANRVEAGSILIGKSAAALTLRHGQLHADLVDAEIGSSHASGQLSVDLSSEPRLTWHGRVEGIDPGSALVPKTMPVVSGLMTLDTDLTASGATAESLANSLSGRISLSMKEGGRLGYDLLELVRRAAASEEGKFASQELGEARFSDLEARLDLSQGAITISDARIVTGTGSLSFTGAYDPADRRLRGSAQQATPAEAASAPKLSYEIDVAPGSATVRRIDPTLMPDAKR